MLVITIHDDSDELWSLKGWSLKYKQLDATTYAWYLTDPEEKVYKALYNAQGTNIQYNVRDVAHLAELVSTHSFTKKSIQDYVSNRICFQSMTF